jgi:hypothetical protein
MADLAEYSTKLNRDNDFGGFTQNGALFVPVHLGKGYSEAISNIMV